MNHGARHRRVAVVASLFAALSLVAAACGSDSSDNEEMTARERNVDVTLQEFAVRPEQDSAPAGEVTFNVGNVGPEDTHEFVIFKTDLAPDALPTAPDGSVDEEGEGVELIDEIEDIAPGDTPPPLTVSLEAGSYVPSATSSRRKARTRSSTTSRGCGRASPSNKSALGGIDRAWPAGRATAAYMTLSNLALTAAMAGPMLTSWLVCPHLTMNGWRQSVRMPTGPCGITRRRSYGRPTRTAT
jgi:hypothetical protein